MVKVEYRVEAGGVVFPHVAVGALDRRAVVVRHVAAADREVDAVVRRFQRHHRLGAVREIFIPLRGRRRVGKNRVVQTVLVFFPDVGLDHVVVDDDLRGQPGDDVLVH